MTSRVAANLAEFHAAFGIPMRDVPTPRPAEYVLRMDLLREEWEEYVHAAVAGDLVEVADALADIVYVAYGTALAYGFDLDAVLDEVHRSNMSKLGEDGRPILREDGKAVKGPNYFRPDVAACLEVRMAGSFACAECGRSLADGLAERP